MTHRPRLCKCKRPLYILIEFGGKSKQCTGSFKFYSIYLLPEKMIASVLTVMMVFFNQLAKTGKVLYFCCMKQWLVVVIAVFLFSCGNNDQNKKADQNGQAEALKNLTTKVGDNPDSAGLRMQLINSLDSLKQYSTALKHIDSLITRDSMNEGLWVTKAHLQESNKDTPNAIKSYEKAIRIYPAVEPQLYLANLFAETKNPKALWLCTNVLKMGQGRETDANCSFIAAVYFSRIGNITKAIEGFDKAIADNYTLIEAYLEKGFIFYDRKDFTTALKVFATAQKVSATNADACYWVAKCNEQLGNKQEALLNFQKAYGLDKTLAAAKEGMERLSKGN